MLHGLLSESSDACQEILSENCGGPIVSIDVEKEKNQDRSLRNAVFQRRNLLGLLSSVGRVKIRFWTSSMINSDHVLIWKKFQQLASKATDCVRSTNTAQAFF